MTEAVETKPEINQDQQAWWDKADAKWLDDKGLLRAPKDYVDNLSYRVWIRHCENQGVDDKHEIKAFIIKECREDVMFFFNTFLWTQDPRRRPADLPFVLYDYEEAYIKWLVTHIDGGKDCLTEKSRDMGMSWTIAGVLLWKWLFFEGFLSHIGSKKEDDVDRSGDIRSLFEKLRYMIKELPVWLKPFGFELKKHSMFMRLINPFNGNSITGESSNRDFGRAGRYSCVLLDEFASMEYADEAWTSTGDSTPCRIAVSTPKGTGNKFWQLRFKSDISKFTAHWTMHPAKSKGITRKDLKEITQQEGFELWRKGEEVSSPWYEAEKKRRLTDEKQSKVDIAQELDIDYIASGDPYFDIKALMKQEEWKITENIDLIGTTNKKLIIGTITKIDGKLEFRPNKNGWLRLFENPLKNGQYVGALDPAEGLAHSDFSAGAFREKKTRNLVAAIYGTFDYDELSHYGYLTSTFFNNCLVCAEAGGYGAAVNKRLFDLGANVARAVDISTGDIKEKDKLGWNNSSASRPNMLGDMEAEIREGACELRDKDLKTECMNFINDRGKPKASQGSTDDFVMAFGIAGQLMRYRPYSADLDKDYKRKHRFANKLPPKNFGFGFKRVK